MVKVSVPNTDINFMTAKADDRILLSLQFFMFLSNAHFVRKVEFNYNL